MWKSFLKVLLSQTHRVVTRFLWVMNANGPVTMENLRRKLQKKKKIPEISVWSDPQSILAGCDVMTSIQNLGKSTCQKSGELIRRQPYTLDGNKRRSGKELSRSEKYLQSSKNETVTISITRSDHKKEI